MDIKKGSKKRLISLVSVNLRPAITVAIVSIPLSIALSIASGAGPVPGIITGFWATIIAGFFGGSRYNVVGPAGALTSILFAVVAGSIVGISGPWVLPILAITSGLMILLAYFLKGERYLKYIPSSVVLGFSAGVAVSIAATQIKEAFGLTFVHTEGEVLKDIFTLLGNISSSDWITFAVFFVGLAFLLIWRKVVKNIPGIIPLVFAGIAFGFFTRGTALAQHIPTIADRYQNLHFSLFSLPSFSNFSQMFGNIQSFLGIIEVSALIAVVAILETLITARVADKITSTRFNESKEMRGLALANIVSGIMGGLPATGVFVRTGLNIKSGATHRISSIIIGLLTGIGAIIFFSALKFIPMATIAAILYITALGLIEVSQFKNMWKASREDFFIAMTVAVLILVFDAGIAIGVGSLIALILFIEKTSNGNAELLLNLNGKLIERTITGKMNFIKSDYDTIVYSIAGFCSYLDAQTHTGRLLKMVKDNPRLHTVVLRMRNIYYFDIDAIESIAYAIKELEKKNIRVAIASCSEDLEKRLVGNCAYKAFDSLKEKGMFFPKSSIAIESLKVKSV
ncbi:MAG: SulP family inorganic anion transporter [Candidatus Moranbacteria bacterium]|jgi:SulP family sulfate permease|nr:SulP family inorganic anion transporter [Candidatus Moranbacteria bacterium]